MIDYVDPYGFSLFRGNNGDAGDLWSMSGANDHIGPSENYPNPAGPHPSTDGYQDGVINTPLSTIDIATGAPQ